MVAARVEAEANDKEQLIPVFGALEEELSETPEEVLAHAGYCSETNLAELERRGITGYVARGCEGSRWTP